MAVVCWAGVIGYSDIVARRIPNLLVLAAVLISIVSALWSGHSPLGADGVSMVEGLGIAMLLTLPGYLLRRLGAGDVKLLAAIGLLGGLAVTLQTFVIAALLAGALTLAYLHALQRGWLAPASGRFLPFGAALALGLVLTVLFGPLG